MDIGRHKKNGERNDKGLMAQCKDLICLDTVQVAWYSPLYHQPSGFTRTPNFCRKHKAMDLEIKIIILHKSNF